MWWNKKQKHDKKEEPIEERYPKRDVTLDELRKAIHAFADQLPDGVELQTIINEDLTIHYEFIAPYLKAIPNQTFYMSKETYEIFEEKDYQLAVDLDNVQRAVDDYIRQTKELPVIEGDSYRKVNYFKLEKLGLLSYRPERDFYITKNEYLVTYEKPENKM
ncbi:DUF3939 domain-containing protein [Pontibacillus marinus]|uniref:DUF3939 domain-containing protein n=1 Tax=Pontibacillus marinus BH030004 = DSM 16465 TaxID=1385511 RepID=A0A0A5FYM8_9BACI|nr:DUF3939 domain-containing protein [Pontibacillus marinus]KGX83910.1 hypothetical protein N783_20675 [Pontibacillus marinus BH030004 = DSM 16465]